MAAKKKAKAKPRTKPATKSSAASYFVCVPSFEHNKHWEDPEGEPTVHGPLNAQSALKVIDEKVEAGCKRSLITVIQGRKAKIELKLK